MGNAGRLQFFSQTGKYIHGNGRLRRLMHNQNFPAGFAVILSSGRRQSAVKHCKTFQIRPGQRLKLSLPIRLNPKTEMQMFL